jgi:hypothetical protein
MLNFAMRSPLPFSSSNNPPHFDVGYCCISDFTYMCVRTFFLLAYVLKILC